MLYLATEAAISGTVIALYPTTVWALAKFGIAL